MHSYTTLQEIEQLIDPMIIDYIKDNCFEEKFEGVEIKEKEKTKHGTKYRSYRKYKKVFNQERYISLVKEYYYNQIKPQEDKKKSTPEKGKNITQKEALQMIFRDFIKTDTFKTIDNKSKVRYLKTFVFNINESSRLIDSRKTISSLSKLVNVSKKYNYYTPSLFIHHASYLKEFLAYMGVIVLDFDLDKTDIVMTKEELRQYIVDKLKAEPNLIIDTKTKGNYQAYFLIERMVGTPLSVHLYEQIVQEMIYQLGEICDESGKSANHIFALPRNDKRSGRLTRKYHDKIYNINQFKWLLDERDKRKKSENKIIDFTEKKILTDPAIKALIEGQVSFRNHAAFTLALLFYALDKPIEECKMFFLNEWLDKVNNDNFDHPITENEVLHCIKHAYSGKYRGPHSKWIQICTGLKFNYRIWKKYKPTGAYKMNTREVIINYFKKNNNLVIATQPELADKLSVSLRSLKRHLSALREEGKLIYETNNAHNGKTVYQFISEEETAIYTMEHFKNYKEELQQIELLEKEINELSRFA